MPYIKSSDRVKLEFCLESINCIKLLSDVIQSEGELNYIITRLCLEYLKKTKERYKDYNNIVGILECAKLEFYRRAVAKYEDQKIKENGDVY